MTLVMEVLVTVMVNMPRLLAVCTSACNLSLVWVDCMEDWHPGSQAGVGESWREITASLLASTLSWLATTMPIYTHQTLDMSRVFTAVSRIALNFSIKNHKVNLDTKLSLNNLLSMMSSSTLNPALGTPTLVPTYFLPASLPVMLL